MLCGGWFAGIKIVKTTVTSNELQDIVCAIDNEGVFNGIVESDLVGVGQFR